MVVTGEGLLVRGREVSYPNPPIPPPRLFIRLALKRLASVNVQPRRVERLVAQEVRR